MRQLRINSSFLLFLISFSVSFQFDYLFFNIPFFYPFLTIVSIFPIIILFPYKSIDQIVIFLLFISALFLFALFAGVYDSSELRRTLLYPGYIVISVFVVNKLLQKSTFGEINKVLRLTLYFCVAAVLIETFFRFYMPTLDLRSDIGQHVSRVADMQPSYVGFFVNQYFYVFKFSSIMFFDSNFVGLFLLPLLVLTLFYLQFNKNEIKFRWLSVLIFLLNLLTFSRSAIISSVAVLYFYFMYKLMKKNSQLFFLVLLFSVLFLFVGLSDFLSLLLKDGSFYTKLSIFTSISSIFEHDLVHILFGYGVDAGGTIYSYRDGAYAHALIPLLLGQFGILGLVVYFTFFIYYSFKVGFFGWLLFFAIMFSGLSLADPWQVLNYFSFLIMAHFKRRSEYGKRLLI